MIRVNLLDGTAEHRVAVQKTKVAARRGQQIFMVASALGLCLLCLGADHLWTTSANKAAKDDLDREQKQAEILKADVERKDALEAQMKEVEDRTKVIKDLRATQETPVPMLSAINLRMPGSNSDFQIEVIKQTPAQKEKAGQIHLVGFSADQQVIAAFARQLENSDGLFTNLSLSIERVKVVQADKKSDKAPEDDDDSIPSRFKFTVDCNYNSASKSN